jgi:hypothetical protein
MLALIDARMGSRKPAEQRLRAWAGRHDDFGHHFLLSQFYTDLGRTADALAALEMAAHRPMVDLKGHGGVDVFALMATATAYKARRHPTTLALCERWECYWKQKDRAGDTSFYVFRAASHLAQGQFAAADRALAALERTLAAPWANKDLPALREAIAKGDRDFECDPGPSVKPFSAVVSYR